MTSQRATLQYAILAVLFAATCVFQYQAVSFSGHLVLHAEGFVADPVVFWSDTARIQLVLTPNAGVSPGDEVLEADGRPLTGKAVWGDLLAAARPGDPLRLKVRSPEGQIREVTLRMDQRYADAYRHGAQFITVLLGILIPISCVLLGFWVALVRPRDGLAWLLLFLLLSFTQVLGTPINRWQGSIRYFGTFYHSAMNQSWPVWMMIFGLYFPERFPAGKWRKAATLLAWIVSVPLSLEALIGTYISVRSLSSYQSVERLVRTVEKFDTPGTVLTYTAIGAFLVALCAKYFLAISRDAKRRLLLVYLGSFISLVPALTMDLVASARHTTAQAIFPAWFLLFAVFVVVLFPLTFAYVIVVHKAMDVRVVLRQGLQYALAKNGVRVLQVSLSIVVTYAAATLATQAGRNRPQKITLIAGGFLAILLLRRGAERLRAWTDRRFFRDAYNAEQILSELSEEVRTIVEPRTLLQTVSQRIAESLHVRQVAVLLNGSGLFKPAYALGYPGTLELQFPQDAVTVRQLAAEKQPARVYLDDPNSWLNRDSQVTADERDRLSQLRAELLLPLNVRENLLGFISLGQKLSEEPYSGGDLRLLQSVAAQTGLALENARLTDAMAREMAQREKMNREIEIAREVQERLFPQQLASIEGLDYCGTCRPALGVGGDYYDFIVLPGGKLGIAIGDVAGKGISAALMMASLQASLRGQAMVAPDDLAKIVTNVNRLVFEASSANRYATFFYGQYDPRTRELSYVNAGHNPPLLLRKGAVPAASAGATHGEKCERRIEKLEVGGMVVGLLADAGYQQGTVRLEPGDLLVAYTDGVSEAMNAVDEEWGEERMLQALDSCDGLGAEPAIQHVLQSADRFAAGAPQFDDMTLVIARAI